MATTERENMDLEKDHHKKRKNVATLLESADENTDERPSKRVRRKEPEDEVVEEMTELKLEAIADSEKDDEEVVKPSVTVDSDEEEEDEPTYIVTSGRLKNYEVNLLSTEDGDDDDMVMVLAFKNAYGKLMRYTSTRKVPKDTLRIKDSYDMLGFSAKVVDDAEDKALLEHERKTWECPKCGATVLNDSGYCPEIIDGKHCKGAPRVTESEKKDWTGCFAQFSHTLQMWKCEACDTLNELDVSVCVACETARGGN